jgi:MFS family permease
VFLVYTHFVQSLTIAAEAGLYPGVAFYITMWYCRHEALLRQAFFFSAASIAGAFSGLLAFAIAVCDHEA